MIFKEKIETYENKIKITISCEMRKFSDEEKSVYESARIMNLIPEGFRNKVNLLSSPTKKISNVDYNNCTNFGEWIFEIIKDKPHVSKSTGPSTVNTSTKPEKTPRTPRKHAPRKKQQ
jgi:hypothetical protein